MQLAKKVISDLSECGVALSHIAARTGLAKSSVYKLSWLEQAPNNRTVMLLAKYYVRMFQEKPYKSIQNYYEINKAEIRSSLCIIENYLITSNKIKNNCTKSSKNCF
jgi:hypothetical protein